MRIENECNVNDWEDCRKTIVAAVNKYIVEPEGGDPIYFKYPHQIALSVQSIISDNVIKAEMIEMLEKEIEDLQNEINKLKSGS